MTRTVALVAIAILLIWPLRAILVRARWTELAPRSALLLWQAVGLTITIALLGACFELISSTSPGVVHRRTITDFTSSLASAHARQSMSPNRLFALTAGLIVVTLVLGSFVIRAVGLSRERARQRLLIDLVSTESAEIPGTRIVEDPRATAFSLPGIRSRVVISSGAIDALTGDELAAVIAHERAHLRARHDLVLLPFQSLNSVLPRSRAIATVHQRVTTLIEMAADDRALRDCEPHALARALCALSTSSSTTLEGVNTANFTTQRVERTLTRRHSTKLITCGSACTTLAVLALPLIAFFAPLGGR